MDERAEPDAVARDRNDRRGIRTNRMEAFSDGVFAIAITLLVLELAVPAGSEADLVGAILAQWPAYLAYVVSFATIGATWLAHSVITEYLDRVDSTFVRLNLLLLLLVSFVPFPTRLVGEYIGAEDAERVAVTLYGLTLVASSVVVAAMWRYASRAGLVRGDVVDADRSTLDRRFAPGIIGYAVVLAVGLIFPTAAVIGYLAIAVYFLVPVRQRRAAVARAAPR